MVSIGRNCPITPVDATRTSLSSAPTADAAALTIVQASRMPRSPVQAFALPLLTTIARMEVERASCSFTTTIGAAFTTLVVTTAAAVAGGSDTSRQRSSFSFLTPQWIPAARNPFGAVTPPAHAVIASPIPSGRSSPTSLLPAGGCSLSFVVPFTALPPAYTLALLSLTDLPSQAVRTSGSYSAWLVPRPPSRGYRSSRSPRSASSSRLERVLCRSSSFVPHSQSAGSRV